MRADRSEERTAVRPPRRRNAAAGVAGYRLGVAQSKLDFDNYSYRWINDAPARIHAKTVEDDWDIVMNEGGVKDDSADLGKAVSQIVGTAKDGSPVRAYLCRKPKDYFEQDQKAKSAELDRQLAELRRGNDARGQVQSDYVRDIAISG
jgi:hypothetical protein